MTTETVLWVVGGAIAGGCLGWFVLGPLFTKWRRRREACR